MNVGPSNAFIIDKGDEGGFPLNRESQDRNLSHSGLTVSNEFGSLPLQSARFEAESPD